MYFGLWRFCQYFCTGLACCKNYCTLRKIDRLKIFNDPVYGFVSIPSETIFDLIEHPYFQRLRRIKQLGLGSLVYPGADHTRFHHALGCLHLMTKAVRSLRQKGHEITPEEEAGVQIAILLHDMGHGPFSHALEGTILSVSHEWLSLRLMHALNEEFSGKLDLAIQIFTDVYPKKFLHRLVSGQLDIDRLDYLKRDSFYTGVNEGAINSDRLIYMMNVRDGELVVDQKGIYSVEKFLIARRLMYWQVYLHKTSFAAERMLMGTLQRARERVAEIKTPCPDSLSYFLKKKTTRDNFKPADLAHFVALDDFDIVYALKQWQTAADTSLSLLSKKLLKRDLLKIVVKAAAFDKAMVDKLKGSVKRDLGLSPGYFVYEGKIENRAYRDESDSIDILYKDGSLADISAASDQLNISALAQPVVKNYLCYPKELAGFINM